MKTYIDHPTPWKQILKDLRIEAGLTQKQLAAKSSMPQRTIAEYENMGSTREISIYKVEKILDTLGYEIDLFLKDGTRDSVYVLRPPTNRKAHHAS